jgi:membrane protease YdiL (CAAX protease family)
VGFDRPAAWLGLAALAPLLAANYFYHGWLIDELGLEGPTLAESLRDAGLTEATLLVFICVFPAVVEEVAFRGLMQHWLQVAIRPWRAMVLASTLFAAMHFSPVSMPYLFAAGMLFGWVKYKTASLYPSILLHFLHNLVVLEFFPF